LYTGIYTVVMITTEGGTSVPKPVAGDVCHTWCIMDSVCWWYIL